MQAMAMARTFSIASGVDVSGFWIVHNINPLYLNSANKRYAGTVTGLCDELFYA